MNERLMTHLNRALLTAVVIDHLYTTVFWLVLRRPHKAWKYALIVGQLSVETAVILHLMGQMRRARAVA